MDEASYQAAGLYHPAAPNAGDRLALLRRQGLDAPVTLLTVERA